MNTTLILIGIGCIIGAIIGGGVKLVQIELSPVTSLWRQMLLGCFGIILVISGVMAGKPSPASGPGQAGAGLSDQHANSSSGVAAGTGADASRSGQGASSLEYVIPDSQRRRLTADDLANLSSSQLRIARNEIYARHGRRFKSADLADHFSKLSWYKPSRDEVSLSPVEQANVELIGQYEKSAR
jgi:hypothetical protein